MRRTATCLHAWSRHRPRRLEAEPGAQMSVGACPSAGAAEGSCLNRVGSLSPRTPHQVHGAPRPRKTALTRTADEHQPPSIIDYPVKASRSASLGCCRALTWRPHQTQRRRRAAPSHSPRWICQGIFRNTKTPVLYTARPFADAQPLLREAPARAEPGHPRRRGRRIRWTLGWPRPLRAQTGASRDPWPCGQGCMPRRLAQCASAHKNALFDPNGMCTDACGAQ